MGSPMKKFLLLIFFLAVGIMLYGVLFYQTPEEKQFATILSAAKAGNLEAQVQAGYAYAEGKGIAPDEKQALAWFRKAALEGDTEALWKCAESYIYGKGTKPDLEESSAFLLLAAKQGSVLAQKELSRFYADGLGGLTKHDGESLYWQFIAAKLGDTTAKQTLAAAQQNQPELYEQVSQFLTDLKQAQEGDGPARLRVGQAYLTGAPVLKNTEEAERWLTLAWQENKLPQAGLILAKNYQAGGDLSPDAAKATALWNELAAQAYPPAQYALGEQAYQQDPPNYTDAFAWFSNAAAGGLAAGQYMTGFMLMQGQGTPVSVPLAITFFRSAAEQDYVSAQYVLGQIYWKGLGVPADKQAGKQWLERAAANGNTAAQALLDEMN